MFDFIRDHNIATYLIYFLWVFGGIGWVSAAGYTLKRKLNPWACILVHITWPVASFVVLGATIFRTLTNREIQ